MLTAILSPSDAFIIGSRHYRLLIHSCVQWTVECGIFLLPLRKQPWSFHYIIQGSLHKYVTLVGGWVPPKRDGGGWVEHNVMSLNKFVVWILKLLLPGKSISHLLSFKLFQFQIRQSLERLWTVYLKRRYVNVQYEWMMNLWIIKTFIF